jgi:signal transduction histidine kinase/CheY-like chemotaxis protein
VSLHAVLALLALVMLAASTGVMVFITRAPGWERVRLMVPIALTAGAYAALDFWFYLHPDALVLRGRIVQANLLVAALHAAAWYRFSFADATGHIRSMPVWARWAAATPALLIVLGAASDTLLDRTRVQRVEMSWLGVREVVPPLSALGNAAAVALLLAYVTLALTHARRAWRGDRSAIGVALGLALIVAAVIEEALVASGVIEFLYLATPGYALAVLPLTLQLLRRLGDDSRRLATLSAQLATEVAARTVERDEARESLLEQQRLAALGRLAAGVGHEINNPLQYVVFQLEELQGSLGAGAPPAAQQALQEALDGTRRIGRVVTSLRTYGGQQEGFRRVPLDDVVQAALRIASPQVRHEATLSSELGPVPEVLGDEGQLVQLLVNPLVNAAQALAASGATTREVTVRAGTGTDRWAEIRILDTGPGFDPALLPRLGEPYVTSRARAGGTGLGLFVTRGLVATHGGTLELRNRPEGGAEVLIRLPPAPPDARSEDAREPEPAAVTAPVRVLVVDDEPVLLAAMQRQLGRLGHEVRTAADGEAALALLAHESVDVVVSDLMMPNMSGAVLAERLAAEHPVLRGRLVVMTGGAVTAEDEAFLSRGDIVVVNKPVRVGELGAALARALATPLALLLLFGGCLASPPSRVAGTVSGVPWPWAPPQAAADSVRSELVAPGVRLHHLVGVDGPWRGAALELDLAACVTLRALKGTATAVGRQTTSALLATLVESASAELASDASASAESAPAIAAVNADFFAFTPPGVPTGAHVELGTLYSGPGARPVVAVDSAGRVRFTTLAVGGSLATARDTVPFGGWNRWPVAGLALLDARWGVPLDSVVAEAAVAAVPVSDSEPSGGRYRVVARGGVALARGDTVLLVADRRDTASASRLAAAPLAALRAGDTVRLAPSLTPFHPREAVGGFPWLVIEAAPAPGLATAGTESFRGLNPRTAVGVSEGGRRVWLVVIDGRRPGWSEGMTTDQLARLLLALGAETALNLDGGGSSALVVRDARGGQPRLVTRPSDPTGERAVGNALAVEARCGRE